MRRSRRRSTRAARATATATAIAATPTARSRTRARARRATPRRTSRTPSPTSTSTGPSGRAERSAPLRAVPTQLVALLPARGALDLGVDPARHLDRAMAPAHHRVAVDAARGLEVDDVELGLALRGAARADLEPARVVVRVPQPRR